MKHSALKQNSKPTDRTAHNVHKIVPAAHRVTDFELSKILHELETACSAIQEIRVGKSLWL